MEQINWGVDIDLGAESFLKRNLGRGEGFEIRDINHLIGQGRASAVILDGKNIDVAKQELKGLIVAGATIYGPVFFQRESLQNYFINQKAENFKLNSLGTDFLSEKTDHEEVIICNKRQDEKVLFNKYDRTLN